MSVIEQQMTPFEFVSMGETCRGRYFIADTSAPTVLMATGGGPKGSLSQTWLKFPCLLAEAGISSIVFDFAGQGRSDGDRRDLTLTKGVRNLSDAVNHVLNWKWAGTRALALMGSSYGGNVILDYLASDSPANVGCATFKSPCIDLRESYLQEMGPDGMRKWERDGYSEQTGLSWAVIEDADRSDLADRLNRITIPLLITHGLSDESVPITQSRLVRDRAAGVVDLLEMNGTNHHYSDRDDWGRMAAVHVGWLKAFFSENGSAA